MRAKERNTKQIPKICSEGGTSHVTFSNDFVYNVVFFFTYNSNRQQKDVICVSLQVV